MRTKKESLKATLMKRVRWNWKKLRARSTKRVVKTSTLS